MAVQISANVGVYNPFLHSIAVLFRYMSWSVLPIILISIFTPIWFINTTILTAFCSASAILVLGYALAPFNAQINKRFQDLDKRHNLILKKINELNPLISFIDDDAIRQALNDASTSVQKWYKEAIGLLHKLKLDDAELKIIGAEMEVQAIQQRLFDRLQISLEDDLTTSINQAGSKLDSLADEFELADIPTESLNELQHRITKILADKSSLQHSNKFNVEDLESITKRVQPIHQLSEDTKKIQTAVRFQQNVDNSISRLKEEIDASNCLCDIAKPLGLKTNAAEELRTKLLEILDQYQSETIKSSNDLSHLIERYSSIQHYLKDFRKETKIIDNTINQKFHVQSGLNNRLHIYIPRKCSTSEELTGGVIDRSNSLNTVSVQFSSLLIETNPELLKITSSESKRMFTPFTLRGKKMGRNAILKAYIRGNEEPPEQLEFKINIIPTTINTIQIVAMIAGLAGPVVGLPLWYLFKISPTEATFFGVATTSATAIGLIIALQLKRIQYRQV